MPAPRVLRYQDGAALATDAAERLVRHLVRLQNGGGRVAQLCLTGGRIANDMYEHLARMVSASTMDPGLLELWWGDECFVPTDDADRNSLQALARLAGSFPLDPARTHPMPSTDSAVDADEAAVTYAAELDGTTFDVCLLGIGQDGHVASLFPGHPSSDPSNLLAIGVMGSPKPPSERISLTLSAINRAREVWFLASGAEKADAVARVFAGDPGLPASHVKGAERTLWFVDDAAARGVPFHQCTL